MPQQKSLLFHYNIKSPIYTRIIRGNDTIWNKVKRRFQKEQDSVERLNLLRALANSREPWIISKLLELSQNESFVRRQNYPNFISYVAGNPVGGPIVWNYFR